MSDEQNPDNHHATRPVIEPNRVYSRMEVVEILNVSLSTVKRMIAAGQLRASQPPGMRRLFITGEAILEMLEEYEIQPAKKRRKRNS